MKQKIIKIVLISSCSLIVVALFAWYFYPVLAFKWFLFQHKAFSHYFSLKPTTINTLKAPPKHWKGINIDSLVMKLPLEQYKNVKDIGYDIRFISDKGVLFVSDIVPYLGLMDNLIKEGKMTYPYVSYNDQVAYYSSTPADISFLNSRSKNVSAFSNQILKIIGIPSGIGGLREILIINSGKLKARCLIGETSDKGCRAWLDLYNSKENVSISLAFLKYQDIATLKTDMLNVLGGIKMPDQLPDRNQVKKDIKAIVTKYNTK